MPFITRNTVTLTALFEQSKDASTHITSYLSDLRTVISTQSVSANQLLDLSEHLTKALELWNRAKQFNGFNGYVQTQLNDLSYDAVAHLSMDIMNGQAIISWIDSIMPKDQNAFLLTRQIIGGSVSVASFSPNQLAPLVALIDAYLAS